MRFFGAQFFLFVLFTIQSSDAQSFRFYTYTTEQGLATNLLKTISADKEGFIWIGSDAGLSRFDGRNFLNFKKEFPNPYMKGLTLTRDGKMLVVNDMGLFQVNQIQFDLVLGGSNPAEPEKLNYPKDLIEASDGTYWIPEPQSIVSYKKGQLRRYVFHEDYRTQNFSHSFQIFEAEDQIFAVAFSGNFFCYSKEKDDFEMLPISCQSPTHAVLKLPNGKVMVGTSDGIFEFEPVELSLKKVSNQSDISSFALLGNEIYVGTWTTGLYWIKDFRANFEVEKIKNFPCKHANDIYLDRENGIWVASDEGLVLMKKTYFSKVEFPQADAYIQGIFPVNHQEILVTEGSRVWRISQKTELAFTSPDASELLGAGQIGKTLITGSLSDELYAKTQNKTIKVEGHDNGVAFNFHLDKKGFLWVCKYGDENMVYRINSELNLKKYTSAQGIKGQTFAVRGSHNHIFVGGEGPNSYLYRYNYEKDIFENISHPISIPRFAVNDLYIESDEKIYLAANEGLFFYQKGKTERLIIKGLEEEPIKAIHPAAGGGFWFGTNLGLIRYKDENVMIFDEKDGLPTRTISFRGIYQDSAHRIWAATANGLAVAKIEGTEIPKTIAPTLFYAKTAQQPQNQSGNKYKHGTDWEFSFASLSYPNDNIRYQYRLNQVQWLDLSENRLFLTRLSSGAYKLEIRAIQPGNYAWSEPTVFNFEILKPWYLSIWFVLLIVLSLSALIYLIVELYTYRLRLQKASLEHQVRQRTLEVRNQNEQILLQKQEIEKQNESIKASINTASRIQQAILPTQNRMEGLFDDHFVIYMPKDIVSGDFYWVAQENNCKIVALADCTGHGVPGALMSMIGITLLDECVKGKNILSPEKILEYLDQRLISALRQEGSNFNEGMDMAVCCITENTLEFAGAKRPMLVLKKNGQITKLQGLPRPIGGFASERTKPFYKETVPYEKGDCLYMFSDGITDQFGGDNRSKFAIKGISQILEKTYDQPFSQQKIQILKEWENWRQDNRILDDVAVLGIRL